MAEALTLFAVGFLACLAVATITVGPMVFAEWRATRRMATGEDLLREVELLSASPGSAFRPSIPPTPEDVETGA